jgi:1,2-phenylacetyl-CoA epoxidase PaaB subunit
MRLGTEPDVYEVFGRFGSDPTQPVRWLGSVRNGDPELAWHAAKEIYTRREDCTLLWVARRSGMVMSEPADEEVLRTPKRLTYRTPVFPGRHRRDRERAAGITPNERDDATELQDSAR